VTSTRRYRACQWADPIGLKLKWMFATGAVTLREQFRPPVQAWPEL
jgi:hypothetical protein